MTTNVAAQVIRVILLTIKVGIFNMFDESMPLPAYYQIYNRIDYLQLIYEI